jgi:hypothetical protein
MSKSFVNPTYFNLQRAIIRSEFSNTNGYDVTSLIPRLSITSSIESETMFGVARVIDSVGLLTSGPGRDPLRGEEQIVFEIADSKTINDNGGTASGTTAEPYRFVGFIYKIDNVQTKEVNDALTYDIHFVSYQSFRANTFELIRAFIDEKISDIAKNVFKDYYESTKTISFIAEKDRKKLFVEPTDGVYRCTIPKMKPDETMGFLSKRAYSTTSPSCLFRFFENSRGFHFVTDEKLFRMAADSTDPDYDKTRNFDFTYLDAIPKTLDYFDDQLNNLEVIENNKRINSFDDIFNGAYRNKVYELDVLSRRLNLLDETNQYDYFKVRNKYDTRKKNARERQFLVDRHTEAFINAIYEGDENPQKKWLVFQNYTEGEKSGTNAMQAETYYADIISNSQAYSKHIESITVDAVGPGRLDITAGDIVDLIVQEFEFANAGEGGMFKDNKHLSGRYIVKSVTHGMERDVMKNNYVLIKRDWNQTDEPPPSIKFEDRGI